MIWGETVLDDGFAGHPGRTWSRAPAGIGELLWGVERFADVTFLVQGPRRVTVGQFVRSIPAAGAVLRANGVRAGDRVLLHAYNSPDWALTLFATWHVGAVPVLGNRWWGTAEVRHAVSLARPAVVVSDLPEPAAAGLTSVHPGQINVHDIGTDVGTDPSIAAVRAGFPQPPVDDPGLVIFTSGSSGAPKAVVLSHRSVIANQHNLLARSGRLPPALPPGGAGTVTLVCTPMFHIGGVSNLITNLVIGGTIVLAAGRFDPAEVLRLLEEERVTRFGGVPTMAIRVLEHPDFADRDLSHLRAWPLGGAPVPPPLLELMARKLPQLARRGLGNTWGMTESGGFLTAAGSRDVNTRPGTVGTPYPVVELRIADADHRGVGEILVRSPTVMSGYLTPDGLDRAPVDADGWLHTGDLGRLDADGYLYIDGRSKDIVIRGGENIACPHVEAQLAHHPDVVELAIVGVPHPELGEEVAAVVVARAGRRPEPAMLQEFARQRLAYFEVPTRWHIQYEALPTLAGEKVDKKRLRALFTSPG